MKSTAQAYVVSQVAQGMKAFNEALKATEELRKVHILIRAGGARGLYVELDKVVDVYSSRKQANAEAKRLNESKRSRSFYFVVSKTVKV